MVLQRWQSVFLLIAAMAMVAYLCMPVMTLMNESGVVSVNALGCGENGVANYLLLTLDALIAILALVTIFKYRQLKFQQRLCHVIVLLLVALLASVTVLALMQRGHAIAVVSYSVLLPFAALFFTIWAGKRIKADRKLLSDSERLR